MAGLVKIASASAVAPGSGMVVTANDKEYAIFNINGTFHVIDNTCMHRGGPLGEGELEGDLVTCPWHGWQYNVRTGECTTKPGVKIGCYEATIEDGDVKIAV